MMIQQHINQRIACRRRLFRIIKIFQQAVDIVILKQRG